MNNVVRCDFDKCLTTWKVLELPQLKLKVVVLSGM